MGGVFEVPKFHQSRTPSMAEACALELGKKWERSFRGGKGRANLSPREGGAGLLERGLEHALDGFAGALGEPLHLGHVVGGLGRQFAHANGPRRRGSSIARA